MFQTTVDPGGRILKSPDEARARAKANLAMGADVLGVQDGDAPPEVFAELTIFLLHWRYFFTRLEPEVVIAACRAASWNPDAPSVLRVIEWLKMPELIADGAALTHVIG